MYSGLGITKTQSVQLFTANDPLYLASGEKLNDVTVAFETYGELNAAKDNAIFICHALTGDAHAAGWHEGDKRPGWWDNLIGPGKPIDTDRWFVISPNILGGCKGTTGPSSVNPETGEPWGLSFPLLDMTDFICVHRKLLEYLGIEHLYAVIGGSMGGMQALQWALLYPQQMDNAGVIASSSQLTAQNIAFSAVGRQAIMRDENFLGGNFQIAQTNPDVGLAIARMLAHITYTSEAGFEQKFGRKPQYGEQQPGFGIDFAVESYLDHQGEVFLSRFDALSYLYLTRVMDYFDPFAAEGALDLLHANPVNFLVISFSSDWRFSTEHSLVIVQQLLQAKVPVSFREISAPWGHDSFLLDIEPYLATVKSFVEADDHFTRNWRNTSAIQAETGEKSNV